MVENFTEGLGGKKTAGAFGGAGVDFAVGAEFQALVRHHFPEELDEFDEGGGLTGAQTGAVKITD